LRLNSVQTCPPPQKIKINHNPPTPKKTKYNK